MIDVLFERWARVDTHNTFRMQKWSKSRFLWIIQFWSVFGVKCTVVQAMLRLATSWLCAHVRIFIPLLSLLLTSVSSFNTRNTIGVLVYFIGWFFSFIGWIFWQRYFWRNRHISITTFRIGELKLVRALEEDHWKNSVCFINCFFFVFCWWKEFEKRRATQLKSYRDEGT